MCHVPDYMILDNDDILVGTPEGIFRLDDEGANWTMVIGGKLPIDDIRALSDGGNGRLFAGTDDHGVFRSYDNGVTWTDVNFGLPGMVPSAETISISCYPNPARENCNVSFYLPAPAAIRIIVTNSLGSEALTLGETFYSRGSHTINLEGHGLSPGIYHVTLATATNWITQKVVIVQ